MFKKTFKLDSDLLWLEMARIILTLGSGHADFKLIVTGGLTAASLYDAISSLALPSDVDHWTVLLSDERCADIHDKKLRNDYLVYERLIKPLAISDSKFLRIRSELEVDAAILDYERKLSRINKIDLAILTLGTDGHVASIFSPVCNFKRSLLYVDNAPIEPHNRLTLSPAVLFEANCIFLMAVGAKKLLALKQISEDRGVVNRLFSGHKNIFLFTDLPFNSL